MSEFDEPQPALVKPAIEVSEHHHDVVKKLREYQNQPAINIRQGRANFAQMAARKALIEPQAVDVNGISAEWVLAPGADPDNRILYLHGGAFMVGSPRTVSFITEQLSAQCGAAVLAIDYRMVPEFKTLDCHHDARIAYEWILENGPNGPGTTRRLSIGGDSAGGAMTLGLLAWARDQGLRAADAAITFAPATDMTLSATTWKSNMATDPFLGPSIGKVIKIPSIVRRVLGPSQAGGRLTNPQLSPLFGDLSDLPPTLIQVSRDEMLYGENVRYANKAIAAGSKVTVQAWPTVAHVFQMFEILPEAQEALTLAAAFITQHTQPNDSIKPATATPY